MPLAITTDLLKMGIVAVTLCGIGLAQRGNSALSLQSIVQEMEKAQSEAHPQVSYQVIREYRLFTTNASAADSEVIAKVDFRPPSSKDYDIEKRSGSTRGEQVVRRILDHEVESARKGRQARTDAVTSGNYEFTYVGESVFDGQPCYLLGLSPKRKQKDLISGQAWVDKQSFLVRHIEGEISKPPSWWLKKVRVKLAFADVDGTWLQTSMEAVADVRLLGPHTLTSRILDYRSADVVASRAPVPAGVHFQNRSTTRTTQ